MNRTNHFPRTSRTALILLLATLLNTYRRTDGIGYHKLGGTSWTTVPNTTTAYRLRPVAVVTVAKE